jgi:hypothetical protein
MTIYLGILLPIYSSHLLRTAGQAICSPTVLLRIEFTASTCLQAMGELLPRLSTLTGKGCRRYISVALVRGSPLAGVTRYPCPVEPGLSSRTGFHLMPAVIRPACSFILHIFQAHVNIIVVITCFWYYNIFCILLKIHACSGKAVLLYDFKYVFG